MPGRRKAAVFMDRDGTVAEEIGYVRDPSKFTVFPWTGSAVRRINESGMAAVLVTNQSAIGRGLIDHTLVETVHERLVSHLGGAGAHLDGLFYCPHHPNDGCDCRKPNPGLLRQAGMELNLDLSRSFMIGDSYTDIRAGHAVGARTVLVLTGHGNAQRETHAESEVQPDCVVPTLEDAVEWVLEMASR
jgi:D-glycero-D-manno-heptose 1,7-bisphosphate phosphatase